MFDFIPIDKTLLLTIVSAMGAFLTFLAIAMPLLRNSEKKKHYQDVVEQRRRSLYNTMREQASSKGNKLDHHTAAQSIAAFYRVQQLAGNASQQARNLLLQAGIRTPSAPLKYLVSRILLPVVFSSLAIFFMAAADKEIKQSLQFIIIFGLAIFGFFLPRILIKNMADKRQQEISITFPDALDMILICVQGGIGIEGAISKISEEVAPLSEVLAEEMGLLSAELGLLSDRKAAFKGFATRVGSGSAKSFATAMMQAEQYGTSVSKAVRVLSDELRELRMAAAEQKAASLPPKLTVPMILFFLPALFVTILGPAFLSAP
ncbi:MAG: type II secretion system F family protein [Pseudomonadota bacterium]|jgi:tight adherence protein C|nr:type II secretion system F family protein [Pseudomonadota bacterium]QKK05018.1 MAG: type II secretion system F family protein [Pseudomonadota bacterium]|tara:strand:+ start:762 stop:1715 length:954 start_codon:yes stop_codon:yes gene_type:complete